MDISILISWKTTYEQVAWSAGHCAFCQQLEAVRIENAVEVVSVWFIPVSRHVKGKAGRCDFCERPVNRVIAAQAIALDEWSPSNDLTRLFRRLAPQTGIQLPDKNADGRLHSLLAAARDASSINNLDITFGVTTGGLLGFVTCLLAGIYLFDHGVIRTEMDKMGFVAALVLPGIVVGAIIGAVVHALFKRGRVAFRKINAACRSYGIDTRKLDMLSHSYGRIVRRATRAARDAASYAEMIGGANG
jgi:hypothetical protein